MSKQPGLDRRVLLFRELQHTLRGRRTGGVARRGKRGENGAACGQKLSPIDARSLGRMSGHDAVAQSPRRVLSREIKSVAHDGSFAERGSRWKNGRAFLASGESSSRYRPVTIDGMEYG